MKILEIEPTNGCNLRCIMCHMSFDNFKPAFFNVEWLNKIKLENSIVKISSVFEPLIHPEIDEIIKFFATYNNKIFLTTNLTNLKDKTLYVVNKFSKNLYSITVSMDSTDEKIYEEIRRGAKFKKVLNNLLNLRENKDLYIRINMVIMKKNYKNLLNDVIFFNKIGIDEVGLIFMTVRNMKILNENLYDIKEDVFKKLDEIAEYIIKNRLRIKISSPYYNFSNLKKVYPDFFLNNMVSIDKENIKKNLFTSEMKKDIPLYMKYNCSAFEKLVKIFADGEVQLCYQFNIGNIKNYENLQDILNLKKKKVKEKIIKENVCKNCDFYRFCINGSLLNINDKKNYFSLRMLKKLNYLDDK